MLKFTTVCWYQVNKESFNKNRLTNLMCMPLPFRYESPRERKYWMNKMLRMIIHDENELWAMREQSRWAVSVCWCSVVCRLSSPTWRDMSRARVCPWSAASSVVRRVESGAVSESEEGGSWSSSWGGRDAEAAGARRKHPRGVG